jgi:hypothetical protein
MEGLRETTGGLGYLGKGIRWIPHCHVARGAGALEKVKDGGAGFPWRLFGVVRGSTGLVPVDAWRVMDNCLFSLLYLELDQKWSTYIALLQHKEPKIFKILRSC